MNVLSRLTVLILLVSSIAACEDIQGNGVIVTERRYPGSFTRVEVSDAQWVMLDEGNPEITVTMDENLLPLVETRVEGDTLFIGVEGSQSISPTVGHRVVVKAPSLEGLVVSGASFASLVTTCEEVRLVGSSRVDLQACKLEYSIVSPK